MINKPNQGSDSSNKDKDPKSENNTHKNQGDHIDSTDSSKQEATNKSASEVNENFKNEYLYLRAEFENYKKNMIKERADLLKFGGDRLAYDLLNVLDIFDKAQSLEVTPDNFKSYIDGIQLTSLELKKTLEKHGIREIQSLGQNFDPNLHEALTHAPSQEHADNTVINVFKKGYKYHDRTLRHAQVVVAKEVVGETKG